MEQIGVRPQAGLLPAAASMAETKPQPRGNYRPERVMELNVVVVEESPIAVSAGKAMT